MSTWTQVHDAVRAAIVTASGYPSTKVIWAFQNADIPKLPFITLKFGSLGTVGLDYLETSTDLLRLPGEEIKMSVKGTREMSLEMQAFTASTADSNDALAVLELVRSSLLLPPIREQFEAVEVTPFDPGRVNFIPDVPNTEFRGRAVCEVRCYVPGPLAVAYVGYIETVEGEITSSDGVGDPSPVVTPFSVP